MKTNLMIFSLILAASLTVGAFGEKQKPTEQSPARTDAEANKMSKGEFSFSGLPPGEYTLRANATGYAPKDKKVTVEGTKTSSVDFQMTK